MASSARGSGRSRKGARPGLSPQRVAAAHASVADKPFLRGLLARPMTAPSAGLADNIDNSRNMLSSMRSTAARFKEPRSATEGVYNYDTQGPKATLTAEVQRSARLYSSMRSAAPRFRYKWGSQVYSDVDYNIDTGPKSSITTALVHSPRHYGIMRSRTARIARPDVSLSHLGPAHTGAAVPERPDRRRVTSARIAPPPKPGGGSAPRASSPRPPGSARSGARGKLRAKRDAAPAAEFMDSDCGPTATLATAVARSPRSYAGMRSAVPRFGGARAAARGGAAGQVGGAGAEVDFAGGEALNRGLDTLKPKPPGHHGAAAVFSSAVPRFTGATPMDRLQQDAGLKAALARVSVGGVDGGAKTTMATSVLRSSNKVSSMRSSTGRGSRWGRSTGTAAHLGPGSYRTEDHDRAISTRKRSITLPMNKVGRRTPGTSAAPLVSNFSMDREVAAWQGAKGGYLSRTSRPPVARAVSTDQVYNTDQGHNKTLATAVATSPRKYAAIAPGSKSANAAQVDVSVYLGRDARVSRPATAPLHVTERRRKGLAARLKGDGYDAPTVSKILQSEDADYAIGAAAARLYAGGAPGSGQMAQGPGRSGDATAAPPRRRKALPETIRAVGRTGREGNRTPRVGRPPGHYYSDTSSSIRVKEPGRATTTLGSAVPRFGQGGDRDLREALSTIQYRSLEHGSLGVSVATTARKYSVMGSRVPRSP